MGDKVAVDDKVHMVWTYLALTVKQSQLSTCDEGMDNGCKELTQTE